MAPFGCADKPVEKTVGSFVVRENIVPAEKTS
jgi:hypothetical protein